jgi:hypothetical protein
MRATISAHTRSRWGEEERATSDSNESGNDVPVGQEALDFERLGGRDQSFALEDPAEQIDLGGRPVGEISEGAFDDCVAYARGLAEEHGGRGDAVGDSIDVHGLSRTDNTNTKSEKNKALTWVLTWARTRRKSESMAIREKSLE